MNARWFAVISLFCVLVSGSAQEPLTKDGRTSGSSADKPQLAVLPKAIPAPRDNPGTPRKIALGKQLFFDPRLSSDRKTSCATCHDPRQAFTDGRPQAVNSAQHLLPRNTPTVLNSGLLQTYFWDGRAGSLEQQALIPIQAPDEMNQDLRELERRLAGIPGYVEQFEEVFGTPVTQDGIAKALAAFQRSLLDRDSQFDRYLAGDVSSLSAKEKKGLELFTGEADCIRCHNGPLLSDGKFYRLAVGGSDPGLGAITMRREDMFKFRTPSLRNIARTAPYMHNGSMATLYDVVEFYFRTAPQRGPNGLPLDIESLLDGSYSEIDALVAFLKTLNGESEDVTPPHLPADP